MKWLKIVLTIVSLLIIAGTSSVAGEYAAVPPSTLEATQEVIEAREANDPTPTVTIEVVQEPPDMEERGGVTPTPTLELISEAIDMGDDDEKTPTATPTTGPIPESTDPSKPIEVVVGEEFAIVLDANPTTGYSWRLSGKVDETIVQLVGTRFLTPATELVGAGGKRIWTFRGVGPGKTALSLEYIRPWEKGRRPVRKDTFTVTVR